MCVFYCTAGSFPLWTAGSWGACRQAHTWVTSKRKYLGQVETGWDVLPLYYIQHSFPTFVSPAVSSHWSYLPVLLSNLAVSSETQHVNCISWQLHRDTTIVLSHRTNRCLTCQAANKNRQGILFSLVYYLMLHFLMAKPYNCGCDKNKVITHFKSPQHPDNQC